MWSAMMPGGSVRATGDRTTVPPPQRLESTSAQVQETQCLESFVNREQCLQPELAYVMFYKVLVTF